MIRSIVAASPSSFIEPPKQSFSGNHSLKSDKVQTSIFGFGRIGRLVLCIATSRDDIDVVAVNDPFIDASYMYQHASLVRSNIKPAEILWGEYGADYVVESLVSGSKTLSASVTGVMGGTKDTQEMLEFCAGNNIYTGIEVIPIDYINEALERMVKKDVKYRFVIDIKKNSLELMFSQGNKKRVPSAVAFNPMMNHFSDDEEDWLRNSCFDSFTYEDSDFVDVTSMGEGENVEIHENSDRDSDGCEASRVFEADKTTFYSMRFKTTEEASAVYNQYAKLVGFSVRKDTYRMRTNGVHVKQRFLCSAASE
ncbi:hypothetical protein IFM89_000155 [Coptis chinensis]|uniref:Glyceraldehyde 3-phosphate dehydrogenase NAD(P) binding domain-containing protein n=1 Tax=Coptis chinensis TaxID=261450 RepID=A0A835H258_9MAGN|nr:hypothetical protein IFM89_000155 [Coptis chinensis]